MNKLDLFAEFENEMKQSCVVDFDSIKPEMDRTFREGKARGEATHFPAIDFDGMFTWKRGFLYCITGSPGHGKSEFLNTLMLLKSKHNGWRWMVYSPESYPTMDYLDSLIHTFIGKSTDPKYKQMSQKEYNLGFEFVKNHFKVIDFHHIPTTTEITEAFIASDCDGLIIDPYNSIDDEGVPVYNFLKKSLTDFKRMAREKERVVVLIEHPHSANSLDDQGNPREPSEYTLSGGKMWHNKCDVIAVVHRPLVHSDPKDSHVTFRTRKIKNQKLNGSPGLLEFNFDRVENRYWKFNSNGVKITGFENLLKIEDLTEEKAPF